MAFYSGDGGFRLILWQKKCMRDIMISTGKAEGKLPFLLKR